MSEEQPGAPPVPEPGAPPAPAVNPDIADQPAAAIDPNVAALIQALQAAASGGATSAASRSFTPPTPIMGSVATVGTTEVAWCGGKPLADWSGLDSSTSSKVAVSPNQYRSNSIGTSQKSRSYRVKGLLTKFERKHDLRSFEHTMLTHFTDHGLDSVTYVPDPQTTSEMICVITDHARF